MKKAILILTMLIFGIVSVCAVFAQSGPPIPSPVKIMVTVNGIKLSYENGQAKNLFTEEIVNFRLVDGVALTDLSNFKQGAYPAQRGYLGDKIEIKTCDLSPKCTFTFLVDNLAPHEFTISIEDPYIIIKDSVVVTPQKTQCFDGSYATAPAICPIPYKCSTGQFVKTKEDCPVESKEHANEIVKQIVIYGGGGAALGFAALYLYYRRKGKTAQAEKMAKTYIEKRKK